jgi:SAM-dependent methyltransferase
MRKIFKQRKDVKLFNQPEILPSKDIENDWQNANKEFWEEHSMRYDWDSKIDFAEDTIEFYKEIDKRFFSSVAQIMPWKIFPFDRLLNFDNLCDMSVLEIGTGNGSHAQLIAPRVKKYTGIDLTNYGSENTRIRLKLFGIEGDIYQMDAEKLTFENETFDLVWSWGVIHHSSNTMNILEQIHRVLKPKGKAIIMVYYRSWWSYYFAAILVGIFKGKFFKGENIHQIIQSMTDGAIARYYTKKSWNKFVNHYFNVDFTFTSGNKPDILPIPGSKLKSSLLKVIPLSVTSFLLEKLNMGSFLVAQISKM